MTSLFRQLVIIVALIIVSPTLTLACEKSCRVGIAEAFTQKYSSVTASIWTDFYASLEDNALQSVKFADYLDPADVPIVSSKVTQAVEDQVLLLEKQFDATLPAVIENAIFWKQPQFRGDCNHPFRVKQPKPPAIWTMEDCEKMDYICGNPPSICHFFPMIKERNYRVINEELSKFAHTPEFLAALTGTIEDTLVRTGKIATDKVMEISKATSQNLVAGRDQFVDNYNKTFCAGESCDQFDNELKLKLLEYP